MRRLLLSSSSPPPLRRCHPAAALKVMALNSRCTFARSSPASPLRSLIAPYRAAAPVPPFRSSPRKTPCSDCLSSRPPPAQAARSARMTIQRSLAYRPLLPPPLRLRRAASALRFLLRSLDQLAD